MDYLILFRTAYINDLVSYMELFLQSILSFIAGLVAEFC
jgi:hypothetical protein